MYSSPGWTVGGASVGDAVIRSLIDSGQTTEEFMWFDRGELGVGSLDGLKEVVGVLVVEDYATSAVIGEYAFEL